MICGLGFFAVTTFAPFVAWRSFRRREQWRSLVPFALATGALFVILFVIGPALGPQRVGLWQRVFLIPFILWQSAVGLRLSRLRAQAGTLAVKSPGDRDRSPSRV